MEGEEEGRVESIFGFLFVYSWGRGIMYVKGLVKISLYRYGRSGFCSFGVEVVGKRIDVNVKKKKVVEVFRGFVGFLLRILF